MNPTAATEPPSKFPVLLSVVMIVGSWRNRVREVVEEASRELASLVVDHEIVLIDNQPADVDRRLYDQLTSIAGLPNVQVYCLLQPVDFEVAAWAGVENSLGDYVLVFNPMEESLAALAEGLTAAATGNDLVLFVNTTPHLDAASDKSFDEALLTNQRQQHRWHNDNRRQTGQVLPRDV